MGRLGPWVRGREVGAGGDGGGDGGDGGGVGGAEVGSVWRGAGPVEGGLEVEVAGVQEGGEAGAARGAGVDEVVAGLSDVVFGALRRGMRLRGIASGSGWRGRERQGWKGLSRGERMVRDWLLLVVARL